MSQITGPWRAGAAASVLPVAAGTSLTGYMARGGPATGTLDSLTIGALMLEGNGRRLVIVAADLAAVDAGLVREIAAAASIAPGELALCASHTHSGPAGVVARLHPANPNELDPALRARFVEIAAASIAAARRDLQPVDLLFGQVQAAGVAANRNDPAIPADDRLSVLATRRADGSLHCAVVHFACHPTILGAASRVVSADFPGALRRQLSEFHSRGDAAPIVLYVNGAAGDVSTRFTRRAQDAAEVERLGHMLATAADDALRDARALHGLLCHHSITVPLLARTGQPSNDFARNADRDSASPPQAFTPLPPSPHRSGRGGNRVGAFQLRPQSAVETSAVRRIQETRAQGQAMLSALAALPEGAIATKCELAAWRLGDLALASVPAELFSSFGQQIVGASDEPTLVLGYANGYIGYLADRQAFEAETYEALASPYGPEAGERVAAAAAALVSQLRKHDISGASPP